MLWGGRDRICRACRLLATSAWVFSTFLSVGCGAGSKAATSVGEAPKEAPAPGVPQSGDEGWCDPMPELGETCDKDLKECTIVCDYISDTCAALVCMGGLWEYLERGEGTEDAEE